MDSQEDNVVIIFMNFYNFQASTDLLKWRDYINNAHLLH